MADPAHLEILRQGKTAWNKWRRANPRVTPDLSAEETSALEADILKLAEAVGHEAMPGRAPAWEGPLAELELGSINLRGANLHHANLSRTQLMLADLTGANLRGANLAGVVLTSAKMNGADLTDANLHSAILRFASLKRTKLDKGILRLANLDGVDARGASLKACDLSFASLNEANLSRANLTGAFVYGASVWNVELDRAIQQDLRITRTNEGHITVDDLRIAQFLYLILNNRNVRHVIDTLTTKVVLILGRFTPDRKPVLDAIKDWLSRRDYVPILFDFERPSSRDFTETVVTLAHLARFVVADLTNPASIPKELESIVPRLAVPVQPLLQEGSPLYAMFSDYWKYDWVLELHRYRDLKQLMTGFLAHVVRPAERKAEELARRRNAALAAKG